MTDACKEVGLTPTAIKRYGEFVLKHYLPSNDPSVGLEVSRQELTETIGTLTTQADRVCANPELSAKAAVVLGFATEAGSLDANVLLPDRQRQVEEDYKRFKVLTELGQTDRGPWGKRLPSVRTDVDYVTDQFFAKHTTAADPVPAGQPEVLKSVLDRVDAEKKLGHTPVVVFDLDDTLFSPASRSVRILGEYAEKNTGLLDPTMLVALESIQPQELVYDLQTDLPSRFNVNGTIYHEFMDGLKTYWLGKFFSNDYAAGDPAYTGAAEFVNRVHAAGAQVVYLTGRQEAGNVPGTEKGMRQGTEKALRNNNFPPPDGHEVRLMMKPHFEDKDLAYKSGALSEIDKLGTTVAVFDNEPSGDAMYVSKWPEGIVVRVGRCRAPNPKIMKEPDGKERPTATQDIFRLPPEVRWIQDFRTEGDKLSIRAKASR